MFFPSMLSAKKVILRSRNETKGLKVCGFSQQRNMLPELLYIELSNSLLIGRKSTANFRNQRP